VQFDFAELRIHWNEFPFPPPHFGWRLMRIMIMMIPFAALCLPVPFVVCCY